MPLEYGDEILRQKTRIMGLPHSEEIMIVGQTVCTQSTCVTEKRMDRFAMNKTAPSGKQESCAIAKMTAQCALYMGTLKIFGTP